MKLNKLIFIVVAGMSLSIGATAQVNGRLPRKAIIGAMQNAMQDSTGSSLKPFVCKPNTVSITIEVTNNSLPEERPYTITADSLGVTLEIFRGNEHVYNEFFHYRGSNFARIKAKANSAKLKKVKVHGDALDGGNTTVLNFNNRKGTYFRLSDNSGKMDYEGDFDGVITEITRQIPNFQAIICKDYGVFSPAVTNDEIKLNNQVYRPISLTEISGIMTYPEEAALEEIAVAVEKPELIVSFLNSKHDMKLIKMRKFKGKKKKMEFYGISYEDVVKNSIEPMSKTTTSGATTLKFNMAEASGNYYVLYDGDTNKAICLKIVLENAVG